jgi:hypothetical protein
MAGRLYIILSRGLLLDPETGEFPFVRELTADEVATYWSATNHVEAFNRWHTLLPLLKSNADEVVRYARRLGKKAPDDGPRGLNPVRAHDEMNRLIVNYLTSMRLYLDHTEARLKRHYESTSGPLAAFKQQAASEFDTKPEYRLFYKLRNYVQHVGLPVHRLHSVAARGKDGVHSFRDFRRKALTHRDTLLGSYDEWGQATTFLRTQPETFELHTMIPIVTDALERVDQAVVRAEIPSLRDMARRIQGIVPELFAPPGERYSLRVRTEGDDPLHVHFTLPSRIVYDLLGVDWRFTEPGADDLGMQPGKMDR